MFKVLAALSVSLAAPLLISCSDSGANSGATAGSSGVGSTGGSVTGSGGDTSGPGGNATTAGSAGMLGAAGNAGAANNDAGRSAGGGSSGAAGSGNVAGSSGSGGAPSTEKFSFFVTSMVNLVALAKAQDPTLTVGFGGDLSYGEVGAGAGLRGADKLCAALAEKSMPSNNKRWRAFLSATQGEDGQPVNAISRIGNGPWYDRTGRLMALNVAGLKSARPSGGDATIAVDLPNELGVPNHQPDPSQPAVDNHDTLTGSNTQGNLYEDDLGSTCNDWTSRVGSTGIPRIGHSWPRSANSGRNWLSDHNAGGCAPGINIMGQGGPGQGDLSVGAGGGYGGFYCFALDP